MIVDSAKAAGLVLDGELFIEGNSDFGLLSSTLSTSVEVMAERGLKFHAFDAVTYDEWHGQTSQEPFEKRYERYRQFQIVADYARDTGRDIFVAIEQVLCKDEAAADAYYQRIKEAGGEGVMMRTPYGKYQPNTRSKDIVKRKVWNDCSAKIVAIHQQACPVKQADEVREVDGIKQGFKHRAGSVTVEILPDQPLPAGTQQNTMFTPAAFHLRDLVTVHGF